MSIINHLKTLAEKNVVTGAVALQFKDANAFKSPESLICYEQNLIPDDELFDLCNAEYGGVLSLVPRRYVTKDKVDALKGTHFYPLRYDSARNTLIVGTLPEFYREEVTVGNCRIEKVCVPLYLYVQEYTYLYGSPDFILPLPPKDKLEFIFTEASQLGASELNIVNTASGASVYYNVRRKKIHSKRELSVTDVPALISFIATKAGQTIDESNHKPRYMTVDINANTRGRVTIAHNYYGFMVNIRLWTTDILNTTLEGINLSAKTCSFIRNVMLSDEKGLRLVIGETMSGKNTTILTALQLLVEQDAYKIVSVEMPVEQLVDGVEQIEVTSEEEFADNAISLVRQNPDIVYFGEINEMSSVAILKAANTSKAVFSTLHANSISESISRLQDITGMSAHRIVLTMQSCLYQELVRDEENDVIFPVTTCVHFSSKLKQQLFTMSDEDIILKLRNLEIAWKRTDLSFKKKKAVLEKNKLLKS